MILHYRMHVAIGLTATCAVWHPAILVTILKLPFTTLVWPYIKLPVDPPIHQICPAEFLWC